MTLEPEILLNRAERLSKQWDRCAAALMRRDTRAFDHEMARFWMMNNSIPRDRGSGNAARANNSPRTDQ